MAICQKKVIKKTARRTPTATLIDVHSPLAKQMLHLLVQFDLAYDHLKAAWKEIGGIPEQEVLNLMDNARQAVIAFSGFITEFREKVEEGYSPQKKNGSPGG
jgi:formylmethanofuran dehydrogenase subunit B